MGTFVAGSHELSPSINYLLHNKMLSGQISAPASQVANGSAPILMSHQRKGASDTKAAASSRTNGLVGKGSPAADRKYAPTTTTNGTANPRTTTQASPSDQGSHCNGKDHNGNGNGNTNGNNITKHLHFREVSAVPPMPPIKSSSSAQRLAPLTIEEYERNFRDSATDLELVERVFHGGMECNQLRSALWPYLFGLTKRRGRFRLVKDSEGQPLDYVYIEHEENLRQWQELERLYYSYESQWKSIMPDQELRFSTFRERKSLIERDVIRSDRAHPFYSDASKAGNLPGFTTLLMTYMMYDFDIGYLQGMSDLAAPIFFAFNGDLVKSFWVFVEVMKLFRRNFEPSQKTIHFQLNCLFRLIKMTDSKFAQHLNENECSNCFFAFRCIVCQFKRELMKNEDENSYTKVLSLWDTIWSVQRRHELLSKSKYVHTFTIAKSNNHPASTHNHPQHKYHKSRHPNHHRTHHHSSLHSFTNRQHQGVVYTKETFYSSFDPNQADIPRFELTETEKFVLSLCLSMIRRERNQMFQERLDATEIHQHFINPRLTSELDSFIENAYHIYHFLNTDCDMQLLVKGANELDPLLSANGEVGPGVSPKEDTADTYDLLRDYLIISPSSYSTSRYRYSVSQKSWDQFLNKDSGSPSSLAD